jgi:hypothetical protein
MCKCADILDVQMCKYANVRIQLQSVFKSFAHPHINRHQQKKPSRKNKTAFISFAKRITVLLQKQSRLLCDRCVR